MEISLASSKMKERRGAQEGSPLACRLKKISAAGFRLVQHCQLQSYQLLLRSFGRKFFN